MAATYRYYVIRQSFNETWHMIIGSEGNRSYSLGWYHALTSFLPRPAYKLVKYKPIPNAPHGLEPYEVVEEDYERKRPTTSGQQTQ